MERQATALIGRCYAGLDAAGLDAAGLREEVLRRIRRMLTMDAAFFATVDPMTLLFTSAVADEPLGAAQQLFLENEFGREVTSKQIGERVMQHLRKLDAVAYVRFASVYRQFRDAEQFIDEIKQMDKS